MKYTRVALILILPAFAIPVSAEPWIAFSSKREGNGYSRFIVHPDGSNLINLSESLGVRPIESQSPDKQKIVFRSGSGRDSDIFVMDIDGSNLVKLNDDSVGNNSPRWSPDGTQVMWYGWPPIKGEGSGARIYLNDPEGANLRDLGRGLWPHWSPDGKMIGFTLDGIPNTAMIMNADGSERREVPNRFIQTRFLAWSPDGEKVALNRVHMNNDFQVVVMNVDGSNAIVLTGALMTYISLSPDWSPDGRKIVFAAESDIFVADVDGTNLVNLTAHHPPGRHQSPSWSQDGSEIVFQTNRDGNEEIYIMNAGGSNPFNLSNHPAEDCCGYWYNGLLPSATSVSPQDKLVTTWGRIKAVTSN